MELAGRFKSTVSAANFSNITETSHGLDRHALWEIVESFSETNLSICDSILDNLLILAHQKTPLNAWGSMPGNIKILLDKLLIKPEPLVDWRRVVKLFSESSSKTKVRNTMKRPSKRFGTVPGIKIKKLKKLLVAVDTSGSVGKPDLEDFFGEIYHLWRQGAEVKVVECDTKIQREFDYRGKTPDFVLGRGGTDFNEPIRFANSVYQPDGLIYFTDGFAPRPATAPRCPLLWVITKNGLRPDCDEFKMLPGRKAKLVS
jgi:predicted metal-dependent peptidase